MDSAVLLAHLPVAQVPAGEYISVWKALPVLVLLLIWARLLTWADKDAIYAHLPRQALNAGLLGGLVAGVALFLFVPNFWIALAVLLFFVAVDAGVYLGFRAKVVGLGDLKDQFRDWLQGLSRKEKVAEAVPGQVQLINPMGQPMPIPDAEDPMRPAYDAVQLMLTDPLQKNAERIDCGPEKDVAIVRYYVDGVGYTSGSMSKPDASAAIGYLKVAAGLDFNERRKPQVGIVKAVIDGQRKELTVQTAGSTAGEVIRLLTDVKKKHTQTLDQLGMHEHQLGAVREMLTEGNGLVIISAPKDQGLTTMLYAVLRGHDAFLTHIQTIEREPDQDLEGITQNKLAPNASPQEEAKQVDWIISQEPDVIAVSAVNSPDSARMLARVAESKRIYIGMRAGSTFDALTQWRKLVGDDQLALKSLRMIINGRVLRKLCAACKVAFAPDPAMLRKLNLDANIQQLFQARTEPLRDPKGNPIPCEFCKDLRFKGRTGFYEILNVDDRIREVVLSGGSHEQLKAAFRKQRGEYLQESALRIVEAGDTSIQEVLRVLKPTGSSSGARAS